MAETTASAATPAGVEESLILPPTESSAVRAQRFVRSVLADSDVDRDVADAAVILTKALIINGLLHARSPMAVSIEVLPESIRIEVADEGHSRRRDPDVLILQDVARSWGVATISR